MKSSVAQTEQVETVTFLSFCDLCSIIKRNYNQEGKNAFFELYQQSSNTLWH